MASLSTLSAMESGEATPRGPHGPRLACNFEDSRNFVVVCRVDRSTTKGEVARWILGALEQCIHAAAFDTYNRTKSAWSIRFTRESSVEFRALVHLTWDGRRYVDLDALTFVRDTPRNPPVMNPSEILWLLQNVGTPTFLRSLGVSGVRSSVLDELWDNVHTDERAVHSMDAKWAWVSDDKPIFSTASAC
jgi:hypothetical protein